jgi:D-alanyl-D-alanine carboxypeptidase
MSGTARATKGAHRWRAVAAFALFVALTAACTDEDTTGALRDSQGSSSASDGTPAAPTLEDVAQEVEDLLDVYEGIATGAIVLVRVGADTRVLTSGSADVRRRRRMQPGDRFPVQSITKSMMATEVLKLVADGRLRLDDTVEDVLPGVLPQRRRVTIQHLLSHRAGLHDATDEDLPPLARMTRDTLIDIAAAHPLEFDPGTQGQYSNVGYEVLGRVVERVTGKPLARALERAVFEPAGMTDTAVLGTASVKGYYEGKEVEDPYIRFLLASGGVVSTVEDVDHFYTALWAGRLLEPRLVRTMSHPVGVVAPFGVDYGLGVWFHRTSCGDAMGHSGAGPGFNTKAWTLRDADRSVVVMVNDSDGASIAEDLAVKALCS